MIPGLIEIMSTMNYAMITMFGRIVGYLDDVAARWEGRLVHVPSSPDRYGQLVAKVE